jgi:hypothetical protein
VVGGAGNVVVLLLPHGGAVLTRQKPINAQTGGKKEYKRQEKKTKR